MHEGQVTPTEEAGRALVADQFPRWAGEPVRRLLTSGTVTTVFRIGDHHAARFPLLGTDPAEVRGALEREARASAECAAASPFPVPLPVALGRPGAGYPLPWSVQTWLPGRDADQSPADDSDDLARDLAALVIALRGADTRGRTFTGVGRGGDLSQHDEWVGECLRRSVDLLDVPRLTALWTSLRELPRTDPDVMTHGDLTRGNVLVAGGRLAGVLDCGGFAPADPALDVLAGWHLLDDGPRAVFRAGVGCDDLQWERSRAWAFVQSLGLVWYYDRSNPVMARMGRRTLDRVLGATAG